MESQKYCAGANNRVVTVCPKGYTKTNDGQCDPEKIPAVRIMSDNEVSKQKTTVTWNYVLIGVSVTLFLALLFILSRCRKN